MCPVVPPSSPPGWGQREEEKRRAEQGRRRWALSFVFSYFPKPLLLLCGEDEWFSPTIMAATMKKAAAEDVNVTFEDQQKINKFARNTSRITELKEEIEVKKKQLQNLEDACDDIMMLDDGDSLLIPYQIGDVFISHSQEETQEMLEEAKKSLQEEIDVLESRVESIQRVLSDLKVQLYAKFGNNINLEAEDS